LAIFGKTLKQTKSFIIDLFDAYERGGIKGQDGIFDTFFSKDEKLPLTPESLNEFKSFKEKFNNSFQSPEVIAEDLKNVDQRIIDYAKTCKNGQMTTEGFKQSMNTMSRSAKAGALALQALSTAFSMVAMFAIAKVIEGISTSISNYINRVEIAKEKMEDSVSSYNSVKSELESIASELKTHSDRINELNAQDNLSYADAQELKRLQEITKELTVQQALKEKEFHTNAAQVADNTVAAYQKEFSKYEFSESRIKKEQEYINWSGGVITDFDAHDLAGQIAVYEELTKRKDEAYGKDEQAYIENKKMAEQVESKIWEQIRTLQKYKSALSFTPYEQLTEEQKNALDDINYKIEYTWKQINPEEWAQIQFDDLFRQDNMVEVKKELIQLFNNGELTNQAITSNEKFQQILKDTGLEAEDLISYIQSLQYELDTLEPPSSDSAPALFNKEQMISAISDLSEGFAQLDKIYSGISDTEPFDLKMLDGEPFRETFSGLGDAYTDFIDTITDSPNDITKCQEAFDDLLTEWINSIGILDHVSESTADLTTTMLSNMGVANAQELVDAALAERKAEAAWKSKDLTDATKDEILALSEEAGAIGVAEDAFISYVIQKMMAETALDPSRDISALASIVNSLGIATSAWQKYYATKARMEVIANDPDYKSYDEHGNTVSKDKVLSQYANIAAIHQKDFAKDLEARAKNAKFTSNGGKSNNYGGSGSDSGSGRRSSGSSGGGSRSSSSKEPVVFDFMDKKIENFNVKINKLKDNMDSVTGYKNKNSFADSMIHNYERQIDFYNQMMGEYQKKADEISLPAEYIEKVKNGSTEIESVSDEALAKQIQDYQKWQKEIDDCSKNIDDIKNNIQDLKKEQIDNIIEQYDNLNKSTKDMIDTQESLMELMEESGEQSVEIGDYEDLVEKQISYAKQSAEAIEKIRDKMRSLSITEKSEEWMEWNEQIRDYESNMLSAAKAVEKYKNKMVELTYKALDDYNSKMDRINNTISTMHDLIGNDHLLTDDGQLTERGLAQAALYAQELAYAKQMAEEYAHAMRSLDKVLSEGLITEDEYNEKLKDYRASQEDAVAATKAAQEAIFDLIKDSIQAEIDAKREAIEATKDQLKSEQELNSYRDSIAEKSTRISILQKQIDTLSLSSDRKDMAQKLQLQEQLANLQKELYEEQADQAIRDKEEALDQELDAFTNEKENEIKELESNLEKQDAVIKEYLGMVQANYAAVYETLSQYGESYNLEATKDLTTPWGSGSEAANLCASAICDAVAQINYELANIDTSPLYDLIQALQNVGLNGLGSADGQWEDVTGQGKWHQNDTGWWYGASDDDYVSNGYYTIKGKTYNFNEDGYMKSGWDDSQGDWYYFEPENGEMVKSSWRKDKNGDWYYLMSDGRMARNAIVKSRDGKGYYQLDSDGKWDGKTLTLEEANELGYDVAYKDGTKNSIGGRIRFDEEGLGSEVIVTKYGGFIQVPAGSHVFNSDQVNTLWDLSKGKLDILENALWNSMDSAIIKNKEPNIEIKNSVNIQGDASEKTVRLISNALDDFSKNRMAKEFSQQLRYQIKS
jgi:glucan-binding YG repeat protein